MINKDDLKLSKDVCMLYDRLNKKEMNILTRWVLANRDVVEKKTRLQERKRILKIIRMEINDTTLKLFLTSLKFKKLNKEFEIHEAIKTILGEYREFFLKDLIKEIEK